jgi:hypothetical protein
MRASLIDTEHYVLNRLIETTPAKNREFLAWRAEQTANVASVAHRRASVGPRGGDRERLG